METDLHLFISPHLDDVALSCGGYVRRISEAGKKVVVVTVMTADLPKGPVSWLARRNHLAWHLGDAPFALRRGEDEAAVRALGATHRHLGLLDAMYRRDDAGRPLYISRTVGVPVHLHDRRHYEPAVRESLGQILRGRAGGDAKVFCPLGAGEHVDHLIVREAVESLWDSNAISYYEDYPYAGQSGAVQARLICENRAARWDSMAIELSPSEIEARVNAVACYVSQLPGLFPSTRERLLEIIRARLPHFSGCANSRPNLESSRDRMSSSLRAYIACVGGERYWTCSEDNVQCSLTA